MNKSFSQIAKALSRPWFYLALLSVSCVGKVYAMPAPSEPNPVKYEKATFAGGCFWCMEKPFDELPGVVTTISGYTGGKTRLPTYKQVSAGKTGHYEAIQITYDPKKITFKELLAVFWVNIDPVDETGQFCDKGPMYRSAIFYHSADQKLAAENSIEALNRRGILPEKVKTPLLAATTYYPAEDYHQDYYKKNPWRYKLYRKGCGRDKRLEQLWR